MACRLIIPLVALFFFSFAPNAWAAEKVRLKVVSLAPSNTELIYSLGAEEHLVGVSSFCQSPKQVVGSFVNASFERLASIKPDLILLVTGQEVLANQLIKRKYKVLILPNEKIQDIASNLKKMGDIFGKANEAQKLNKDFLEQITHLKQILNEQKATKTLICVWPEPVICVGKKSFIADLVTVCGGENVLDRAGISSGYSRVSQEALLASHPQVIILPFEAKDSKIRFRLPWSRLCSVKGVSTFYLPKDKSDFLSRPSLRVIEGLYWLASRLHPKEKLRINQWLEEAKLVLFKKDIEPSKLKQG